MIPDWIARCFASRTPSGLPFGRLSSLRLRAGVVTIYIPERCHGMVWGAPLVFGVLS